MRWMGLRVGAASALALPPLAVFAVSLGAFAFDAGVVLSVAFGMLVRQPDRASAHSNVERRFMASFELRAGLRSCQFITQNMANSRQIPRPVSRSLGALRPATAARNAPLPLGVCFVAQSNMQHTAGAARSTAGRGLPAQACELTYRAPHDRARPARSRAE